jgi:hypothetical protein
LFSGFLDRRPGRLKPPSKKPVELSGRVYDVQKKYSKKGKDSSVLTAVFGPLRELPEPDNLARFPLHPTNDNHYWSHHRTNSRCRATDNKHY